MRDSPRLAEDMAHQGDAANSSVKSESLWKGVAVPHGVPRALPEWQRVHARDQASI